MRSYLYEREQSKSREETLYWMSGNLSVYIEDSQMIEARWWEGQVVFGFYSWSSIVFWSLLDFLGAMKEVSWNKKDRKLLRG